MYITTVTKGADTTYRLHRDSCKLAKGGSARTLEAQLDADAQIVLDATQCSTCKPGKAMEISVRHEAQGRLKGKAPKGFGTLTKVDPPAVIPVAVADDAAAANAEVEEALAAATTDESVANLGAALAEKREEQAPKAEATTSTGRGHSLAPKDGEKVCKGACGLTLPLTKFPTLPAKAGQVPQRGDVCRADRNAEREAKKASK